MLDWLGYLPCLHVAGPVLPKKMNTIAIFGGIVIKFLFAIALFALSANAGFEILVGIVEHHKALALH